MPGLSSATGICFMFIFQGIQGPVSTQCGLPGFLPCQRLGLLSFYVTWQVLWHKLSVTRSGEMWAPQSVPQASRLERTFPSGFSCHSASASTHRTALRPQTFPSQPLQEEPQGGWSPAGPGGRCGSTMDTRMDRALTVRASITSWKFLFPTILFFTARKASLGLAAPTEGCLS